jgi:hypothetical protein
LFCSCGSLIFSEAVQHSVQWSHLWCGKQKLRHELGWHLIFQPLTTHLCS